MATPKMPDSQPARVALFVGLALAAAALLTWSVLPAIWSIGGSEDVVERPASPKKQAAPAFGEPAMPAIPPPLLRARMQPRQPQPQPLPLPAPVVALPAEPPPVRTEVRGFDFAIPPVQRAIRETLESGNAERWRQRGARGYAVASRPERRDGSECRNVYATAETDGGEYRSPTWTYCRSGGRWARR